METPVGVVTYAPVGDRLLAGLPAATARPVHLVVVAADDAPVPGAQVVPVGEHLARAAAVNRGVVALPADVEWVLVADPRLDRLDGVIDTLLAGAAQYPRAGALGPRLRGRDGAARPSAGDLPTRRDLRRRRIPVGAPRTTGPVGWVAADCLLLRRAAWESVDGFDARHLGPLDAVDLGRRLRRTGWLSVHVPGTEVVVGPGPATGMLETVERGLRRYAQDRRE